VAVVCVAIVLMAVGVQALHHCTALESGGIEPGSAPVYCVVCMTAQVALMAAIVLVLAIGRVRSFAPTLPILSLPDSSPAFSLYVRPPPALSL
jgi:hypothetical protein